VEAKELHASKKGAHESERAHKGKWVHIGELSAYYSGGQKKFLSLRSLTHPLLCHFQNDGATVECSVLILLQIQLAILCF